MSTYLDRLSMATTEDDDADDLLNEQLEQLNVLLFGQRTFVMLTMNYRKTGHFDVNEARKSILQLLDDSKGMADIKACCKVFAMAMDDFVPLAAQVTPMFHELMEKYKNY